MYCKVIDIVLILYTSCIGPGYFSCDSGGPETVDNRQVCDAIRDCSNGRDELGCRYFTCSGNTKLNVSKVCDGFAECPNSDDEYNCSELIITVV